MRSNLRSCVCLLARAAGWVLPLCFLLEFTGCVPQKTDIPQTLVNETASSSSDGVLFEDDFSSEQASIEKGWLISSSDDTDITWSPNKLTIAVKKKEYAQFDWPETIFRDFGVEIEAEPSNEAGMLYVRYGILFGIKDESADELFDFGVTTTGKYSLGKVSEGKLVQPMLVDFTPSPCLQPRPGKNRLGVLVEGSKISLYVNGSFVKSVVDSSINSGYVGVSVNSFWSDKATVSFGHMTVLTAERARAEWGTRPACVRQVPADGIWFDDDFGSEQATNDKGWYFTSDDERETRWSPNRYEMTVKQKGLREVGRPVGIYDNFGVEIEATPDPSSSVEYGIAFRYNAVGDIPDEYVFGLVVRSKEDSYYYMGKENGGRLAQPTLVPVRTSTRIEPNWSKNRLAVLADGPTLSLYINGARVKTITDRSLTSGEVGVFVGSLDSERVQVAFSRMRIYTVEKAKALWGEPPTPVEGVLYQADFKSEEALADDGWKVGTNNAADNTWSPGKMAMSVKVQNYPYLNGPFFDEFGDFGVEVEAQPEDDPGYSYGIIFRESRFGRDKPSYYIFAVTASGFYMLRRSTDGVFADPDPVDITSSPYIQKGASKNRLGVLAEGPIISLYINGKCVKTISGETPLRGKVEVFILSGSKERTQVDFSSMTIYSVEEAKKRWGAPSTVVPEPTKTPGIIFTDDFSSKEKSVELGWTLGTLEASQRVWAPNELDVIVTKRGAWDIALAGPPNNDFGVEIEAQPEDKQTIQYGIVFRYSFNQDKQNFYLFVISVEGEYSVMKEVDGQWASQDVIPATPSAFIKKGPSKNRLGVLAVGSTISLYINGNLVKTFEDTSHSWGGAGIFTFCGNNDTAKVAFSRFTIYTVEGGSINLERK